MTHEYTLLVGGVVIRGDGESDGTAIAWAADTILAIGSDDEVRAISRGDSHEVDLEGAFVVGLGTPLVVGGVADLSILDDDPRKGATSSPVTMVRRGRVTDGFLPGTEQAGHDQHA